MFHRERWQGTDKMRWPPIFKFPRIFSRAAASSPICSNTSQKITMSKLPCDSMECISAWRTSMDGKGASRCDASEIDSGEKSTAIPPRPSLAKKNEVVPVPQPASRNRSGDGTNRRKNLILAQRTSAYGPSFVIRFRIRNRNFCSLCDVELTAGLA